LKTLEIKQHISHDWERQYLLFPFDVPAQTERIEIDYYYTQNKAVEIPTEIGEFVQTEQVNILDLGLIGPDGRQIGASGSNKTSIFVSTKEATPGYLPDPLTPGTYQIMLGAYVVAKEGVEVTFNLRFFPKVRRWLKGDLHTHTFASDGQLSLEHLGKHAREHGLDFIAVTDHNQPVKRASFPKIDGLTIIPGMEWTHYEGHSNFFGIEDPYDGSFVANTPEEMQDKFQQAKERGALISINHPMDENCPFLIDISKLPYDLIEVWNGPMRPANLKSIAMWDQMLKAGKKQVAVCGSDYHRDTFFQRLAGPTINVLSWSASEGDILEAVQSGHSYFTYSPTDLQIDLTVENATYGSILNFHPDLKAQIHATALEAGDQIKIIDQDGERLLFSSPGKGNWSYELPILKAGYLRIEVWRTFFPGVPLLPALVTNPIWLD